MTTRVTRACIIVYGVTRGASVPGLHNRRLAIQRGHGVQDSNGGLMFFADACKSGGNETEL
jgi:hypothetical protein